LYEDIKGKYEDLKLNYDALSEEYKVSSNISHISYRGDVGEMSSFRIYDAKNEGN
jgi:hypothetical protein